MNGNPDIIRDILTKKLVNATAKEINLEAMAKRLAPRITKMMEKEILAAIPKVDWAQMLDEAFSGGAPWKAMQEFIVGQLLKNAR